MTTTIKPTTPRLHGQRPHPLMDELTAAVRQVRDVTRKLQNAHAGADLAPEPGLPVEPTTGEPRPVKGQYATEHDALVDARLVIQQLAAMLRPFTHFHEMRVIDQRTEPRTVCDVVLPMALVSQIGLTLDQVQSFVLADQHLRERLDADQAGEVVQITAAA